jgi:gluconate kinase
MIKGLCSDGKWQERLFLKASNPTLQKKIYLKTDEVSVLERQKERQTYQSEEKVVCSLIISKR